MKAATPQYRHGAGVTAISIHAAREGGDASLQSLALSTVLFQSTPPVKAATKVRLAPLRFARISIHAAREGGDAYRFINIGQNMTNDFNPRRP